MTINTMPMTSKLKRRSLASLTIVATLFMAGCEQADETQIATAANPLSSVSQAAEQIQVKLRVDNNYLTEGCPNNVKSCYQATMTIALPEHMPNAWRIMFSSLTPIIASTSNALNLVHVNGDMHEITPKNADIKANTPYEIQFYGNSPLASESVLFPNYILVADNGEASVITSTTEKLTAGYQLARPQHVVPFTRPEQLLRTADDKVAIADAQERFARFSSHGVEDRVSNEPRIIPKLNTASWSGKTIELSAGIKLPDMPKNVKPNFATAITQRFNSNALQINAQGLPIKTKLQTNAIPESYTLLVTADDIQISYADSAGFYYAMMSIAQLYDAKNKSLPLGLAEDQPDMTYRGLHIDVSRNFRSKDFILKALDQMSYYKLNKLHLHLADDEGWRLQIDSLPELTDVGAFRCFDESEQSCLMPQLASGNGKLAATRQNSGFYSIEDYIEILQYADARQIEVLPSLDMPGHSRAAIVSMNARYNRLIKEEKPDEAAQYLLSEPDDKSQYRSIQHYNDNTLNPCLPATYTFIGEVLEQLIDMHKMANVPLKRYHIGADETAGAWTESPACAALIAKNDSLTDVKQLGAYFVEKVATNVSELGVIPAAWSDGLSHANPDNLPKKIQSHAWEALYQGANNKVHKMINNGWDVVLSTPDVLYFDFPYEADPIEPGYYWGSRFTDSYQVFQFMPHNLPVHAEIWTDKLGHNYATTASVDIQDNRKILGIQAQIWGETVRSDAQANYMLFPRLLAVAERAWHKPEWAEKYQAGVSYSAQTGHFDSTQKSAMDADWLGFTRVLVHKAMPQLVKDGIQPRVPLPGAIIKDRMLFMQSAFNGLQLEYQMSGQNWQVFENPLKPQTQGDIRIRAKIPNTQVTSREQTLSVEKQ
ncbi:family 20 glycosylhydrolase [Paraglaciecola arctica]|uniref:beta-N-acetylhexosaminidase n=1 Tax=Paraglaciecola arctica BSs20135 TaxID=493475 RepID=K6YLA3_9ALTE|nr:family 20 glycosylhydrolase [Paraglaciecola arctica]GAC18937.1 hexosaminidase [Paraglaciecola arctica BSs20135]